MAILVDQITAGQTSKPLRVKVGGQKLSTGRISALGWTGDILTVQYSPTGTDQSGGPAKNWITLGTIPSGGGDLVLEDPVNVIQAILGAGATGTASIWYEPGI